MERCKKGGIMVGNIQLPDQSINRILGWIERGAQTRAERREQKELQDKLLREFEAAAKKNFDWLSLYLLASSIGFNPTRAPDLEGTRKLLLDLSPPGPARPSRRRPRRDEEDYDQKWGLVTNEQVGT
jgi:hypothetical protein